MVMWAAVGFNEKERTGLSYSKSMWEREEKECALSCWWSVLLLASVEAKRENVLSHVDWFVLLLSSEEAKRENLLFHVGWSVLLLACKEAKRGREWLTRPFMLPREVTRAEWHQSFSLDEIYKFETPMIITIPAPNNDLKFFLRQPLNEIVFK